MGGNYWYYTKRPAVPGAIPSYGLEVVENYDEPKYIPCIRRNAYAHVMYGRELSRQERLDYELFTDAPHFIDVPGSGYTLFWHELEDRYYILRDGRFIAECGTPDAAKRLIADGAEKRLGVRKIGGE